MHGDVEKLRELVGIQTDVLRLRPPVSAALVGAFAFLVLAVAAVGVTGVHSESANRRTSSESARPWAPIELS